VRPRLVVCLGATATQALLGREARVTALRGRVLDVPELEEPVLVTIHPSAVLRAGERRREMRGQLVSDLAVARDALLAPTRVGDGKHS
jgi:uracil-DNA glycosylase